MAKKYSILAKFNGETKRKYTDDLDTAIAALKPTQLHTEVYITVKAGEQKSERALSLLQARKVFNDKLDREIFINNLLLA